ncbi:unnamed protein product [Peniophora sp. CBMAI 1063]|nr:unnamed protein product [Peniophora sp. CBMAI 1063]
MQSETSPHARDPNGLKRKRSEPGLFTRLLSWLPFRRDVPPSESGPRQTSEEYTPHTRANMVAREEGWAVKRRRMNEEDAIEDATLACARQEYVAEKGKSKERSDTDNHTVLNDNGAALRDGRVSPPAHPTLCAANDRLVIVKIVLVNFKSFAGKQEIGPFHKSFSCVVGPNGSGKSNTIDAILFAFGYRAAKMRHPKLSELIHNSAHQPGLNECSVAVFFQRIYDKPDQDDFCPVQGSDFCIARTAYADNTSQYAINSEKRSHKEVQDLLKGHGIDIMHNRFLIMQVRLGTLDNHLRAIVSRPASLTTLTQGEVESIAQMRPRAPSAHEDGLLEYFEDVIGTSAYGSVIEDLWAQCLVAKEDLVHAQDRLRVARQRKNALEGPKTAAEQYIRLANALVRTKSLLLQYQIYREMIERDSLDDLLVRVFLQSVANSRITAKQGLSEATLRKLQDQYEEMLAAQQCFRQRAGEHRKGLEILNSVVELLSVCNTETAEYCARAKRRHQDALGQHQRAVEAKLLNESSIDVARQTVVGMDQTLAKMSTRIFELEGSLAAARNDCETTMYAIGGETIRLQQLIDEKRQELLPCTNELFQVQRRIDVCISSRDIYTRRLQVSRLATCEVQARLSELRRMEQAKLLERDELLLRKTSAQVELANALHRRTELNQDIRGLDTEISHLAARLEESRLAWSASENQDRSLRALNDLSTAEHITGFHGRLGGLGTIDATYDIAITTACSGLNSMVCDTVGQAEMFMDHLRTHNIGRASFLVLEKLSMPLHLESTPLPRLFDLVRSSDPRFLRAFWHALGDTLVAKDIDEANRVAVGGIRRYRVVTLDGLLVNPSGTMSGGGSPQQGGMSGLRSSGCIPAAEVQALEQGHEKLSERLAKAQLELELADTAARKLERDAPEVEQALRLVHVDLEDLERQLVDARRSIQQKDGESSDEKEVEDLGNEHLVLMREKIASQEKVDKIEGEICLLHKALMAAGGSRLLEQRTLVETIGHSLDIAAEETTKAELERDQMKEKIQQRISARLGHDERIRGAEERVEHHRLNTEDAHRLLKAGETSREESDLELERVREQCAAIRNRLDESVQGSQTVRKQIVRELYTFSQAERDRHSTVIAAYIAQRAELTLDPTEADMDPEIGPLAEIIRFGGVTEDANEMKRFQHYTENELAQQNLSDLQARVGILEGELEHREPNPAAIQAYREQEAQCVHRGQDHEEKATVHAVRRADHDALCKRRQDEFMQGFNNISQKLKTLYQMITQGGNAELELVDSLDPFSEGITFSVMPPGKSWRNISDLSGGEKTLSSLALVFALHLYKPSPLYFMDEVDAALDFKNVSVIANYIKHQAHGSQFVVVSLRWVMYFFAIIDFWLIPSLAATCSN